MDVGGNTLLVWMYGSDVAPYMNALHLCFGSAPSSAPGDERLRRRHRSAVDTYWLYAGLMLPAVLWLARMPSPVAPAAVAAVPGVAGALRRHWLVIALISAFVFMHMGAELAFGAYITSYADDLFYTESLARVVNSMFWGGLVVGRLIAVPLALRLKAAAMLRIDLLGAIAAIVLIASSPTPLRPSGSAPSSWDEHRLDDPSSINYAGERMPITGQITALFLIGGAPVDHPAADRRPPLRRRTKHPARNDGLRDGRRRCGGGRALRRHGGGHPPESPGGRPHCLAPVRSPSRSAGLAPAPMSDYHLHLHPHEPTPDGPPPGPTPSPTWSVTSRPPPLAASPSWPSPSTSGAA